MSRQTVQCRHFGRCGGCETLEKPIQEQLREKRDALATTLQPFAPGLEIAWDPPRDAPRFFRNKLLQPVVVGRNGELRTGLYARGSHDLVTVDTCQVQEDALTRFANEAETALRELGERAWDPKRQTGTIRALFARLMPGTSELLLGVITRPGRWSRSDAVADALVEIASRLRDGRGRKVRVAGLVRNLNGSDGNVLLGDRDLPLRGRDHQIDRVKTLEFQVSLRSFYQVHRGADAILYRPAFDMLGDLSGQHVVDGFGGVGTFALRALARGAASVRIVETGPTACRDARENLRRNGDSARGEVVEVPFDEFRPDRPADLLIVDPPRKGLGPEGLETVARCNAERMLYVSCSLESLGRDLEVLCRDHRITAVRLVDLFPHTRHQETMLLLERIRNRESTKGSGETAGP